MLKSALHLTSLFSVGNTISSAMLVSTLNALADYAGQSYLANSIPYLDVPTAHVKSQRFIIQV